MFWIKDPTQWNGLVLELLTYQQLYLFMYKKDWVN